MSYLSEAHYEELFCLAEFLCSMSTYSWNINKNLPYEERNILLEGSSIHKKVLALGRMANQIDGVSGMRYVMEVAFCDAFPHVPVGDGRNRDRDALAVSELNLAWSGIGEWLH